MSSTIATSFNNRKIIRSRRITVQQLGSLRKEGKGLGRAAVRLRLVRFSKKGNEVKMMNRATTSTLSLKRKMTIRKPSSMHSLFPLLSLK
jgi:hypothetical protein